MVHFASKLIENLKLFYKSSRPHFLWVYRCNNPQRDVGKTLEKLFSCSPHIPHRLSRQLIHRKCGVLLIINLTVLNPHNNLLNLAWIDRFYACQLIIIIIINLYLFTKSYHFYMVFLGIVCKIRLKYSKELLDYKVKNTKTYIINNKSYNESWCFKIIFPMKILWSVKNIKTRQLSNLGGNLVPQNRTSVV